MTYHYMKVWSDPSKVSEQDKKEFKYWKEWQIGPPTTYAAVSNSSFYVKVLRVDANNQVWYIVDHDDVPHPSIMVGKV